MTSNNKHNHSNNNTTNNSNTNNDSKGNDGNGTGGRASDKATEAETEGQSSQAIINQLNNNTSVGSPNPADYFGSWQGYTFNNSNNNNNNSNANANNDATGDVKVELQSPEFDTSAMFGLPPSLQPASYPYPSAQQLHIFNPNRFQPLLPPQPQAVYQTMTQQKMPQQQDGYQGGAIQAVAQYLPGYQINVNAYAIPPTFNGNNTTDNNNNDSSMPFSSHTGNNVDNKYNQRSNSLDTPVNANGIERPSPHPLTVNPSSMHSHNSTNHVSAMLYPTSGRHRHSEGSGSGGPSNPRSSRLFSTTIDYVDDLVSSVPMTASPSLMSLDSARTTPHGSPRALSPKKLGKQRAKRRHDSMDSEHEAAGQEQEQEHSDMEHEMPEGVERDGMIWGMKVEDYRALSARERKRVRNRISARTFRAKRKGE